MPDDGDLGARSVSGSLTVEFVWRGDRFVHRVATQAGDAIEPADDVPLETPVYQEVHQQGELVFASGMSGGCHWSASVEPAADGFAFDVACRVAKTTERPLAVGYVGLPEIAITPSEASGDGVVRVISLRVADAESPPYTARCRYVVTA